MNNNLIIKHFSYDRLTIDKQFPTQNALNQWRTIAADDGDDEDDGGDDDDNNVKQ